MRPLPRAVTAVLLALGSVVGVASAPGAAEPTRPCAAGLVALTFDDGPSPTLTPRLLHTLRELDVPATFFMVGERVAASPETARLVERSGFLIGNHSYRHEDLRALTTEQVQQTIATTDAALRAAGVTPTRLMRPPYGAEDPHVLAAVKAVGLRPVIWDVDPRDWESGTSAEIAARILGQLHGGTDIVLQHDGVVNSPASVAAVPTVVREARRRGFCFTGLDEKGRPGYPTPGATVTLSATHVTEGEQILVTVTLDGEAGHDTSVRLGVTDAGGDLRWSADVVTVPAGQLSVQVPVTPLLDGVAEDKESFEVSLAEAHGLRADPTPATLVVRDGPGS